MTQLNLAAVKAKLLARSALVSRALAPSSIEDFEAAHSIMLPEDFRVFLSSVANGGSFGPKYGLLPLGLIPKHHYRCQLGYTALLAEPFQFTAGWVWEDEAPCDERDHRLALTDCGTLILGEEGCGAYWVLVVSGPCRGEVWLMTGEGMTPCIPRLGFVEWLDCLLTGGFSWWATLVSRWGPVQGAYFLSHAAKQASMASSSDSLQLSTPLCEDCTSFLSKVASHRRFTLTVSDPYVVRLFHPSGGIEALPRV